MSARISGATLGRPGPFRRLVQVHKSRKAIRGQRMTVSGWTMATASAQPLHSRDSRTQQPVRASQAWTRRGALEDGQLVPQREVLEHQGAAASEVLKGAKPADEQGEERWIRVRMP
jgi:hypothetical protein